MPEQPSPEMPREYSSPDGGLRGDAYKRLVFLNKNSRRLPDKWETEALEIAYEKSLEKNIWQIIKEEFSSAFLFRRERNVLYKRLRGLHHHRK